MYTNLLERFQGAFGGCAIAEMDRQSPALSPLLMQQGQVIRICSVDEPSLPLEMPQMAHIILLSLLHHDDSSTREHMLSACPVGIKMLSDVISARLQSKMPSFESPMVLMTTIQASIAQQLPLQDVASVIHALPESSPIEKAIALAIYCWRSTPQHFSIALGRSHRLIKLYPKTPWVASVPALTGVIAGISVGKSNLPPVRYPDVDRLMQTAGRLYGLWAGIPDAAITSSPLEEVVIAQGGQFKPRTSQHLTLNSDYE